jgi:hypothetical protein
MYPILNPYLWEKKDKAFKKKAQGAGRRAQG